MCTLTTTEDGDVVAIGRQSPRLPSTTWRVELGFTFGTGFPKRLVNEEVDQLRGHHRTIQPRNRWVIPSKPALAVLGCHTSNV